MLNMPYSTNEVQSVTYIKAMPSSLCWADLVTSNVTF